VSIVFQKPRRGGYYLGIAVPRKLRKKLRKSHFKTIIVEKKRNTNFKQSTLKENLF
jgi:hypothetical protein